MVSKSGRHLESTSASPPAVMLSVASCAKTTPPATAQSIIETPWASVFSAVTRVSKGFDVLISITMDPGARLSRTPPTSTSLTIRPVGSIVITASTVRPKLDNDLATLPPLRATNLLATPGEISATVISNPAWAKCPAIGPPIFPSPINPTRWIGFVVGTYIKSRSVTASPGGGAAMRSRGGTG